MRKVIFLLTLPLLMFVFTSCEEDDSILSGPSDDDMQPVSDNMKAEKGIMNAISYMNPYGLDEDLSGKSVSVDPQFVWIDASEYIIKVDFANVDGSGGSITINYDSNPFALNLDEIAAVGTLENYISDGVTYNGDVNFALANGQSTPEFTLSNTDFEALTMAQGSNVATWLGTKTFIWMDGSDTPFQRLDDMFETSGSATGVSVLGYNYSVESSGLILTPDCEYVMAGTMVIKNMVGSEDETTLTMNYSVNANGDELEQPDCNPYFKLNFLSPSMELNILMNMNDF
ncbi:MAG: hypothetical protein PF489_06920 [Salinivirgaceae bacterium]|jgi:hypothetical protein|nr:hypothetical protein [Salinivirgaceae bacterium]